ncbi:MAG TPA: type II secretion system protein, partial [Gemmatimonadaceae bacterium]
MRRHARPAFTLIEVLISIVLLGIISTALFGTVLRVQRGYTEQRKIVAARETLRSVEMLVTRVLKNGRANPYSNGVGVIDANPLSQATSNNVRVRSDYNPADGTVAGNLEDVQIRLSNDTLYVRWKAGGADQPFAYPVSDILFEYFKTDGTQVTSSVLASDVTRARVTITVPKA